MAINDISQLLKYKFNIPNEINVNIINIFIIFQFHSKSYLLISFKIISFSSIRNYIFQ